MQQGDHNELVQPWPKQKLGLGFLSAYYIAWAGFVL
jgi:hypothetical protein